MSLRLEDYIAEGEDSLRSIGFHSTTKAMIDTGFHEWGFVIYRCVYGDDGAWQRYVEYFEADVIEGLKRRGGDILWTVLEDAETLDGASIDSVREQFVEWRDVHAVDLAVPFEKRMIPLVRDPPPRFPRFTYCLYVDQKCLNTVAGFAERFPQAHRFAPRPPPLVAALIDADFDESEYIRGASRAQPDERGQFPAVDGRMCRYVGWEYVDVSYLGGM